MTYALFEPNQGIYMLRLPSQRQFGIPAEADFLLPQVASGTRIKLSEVA